MLLPVGEHQRSADGLGSTVWLARQRRLDEALGMCWSTGDGRRARHSWTHTGSLLRALGIHDGGTLFGRPGDPISTDAAVAFARAALTRPAVSVPDPTSPGPVDALEVLVTLTGTDPVVWRRLVVPAGITLGGLHRVLQGAMGWTDSHLHLYQVGDRLIGPEDLDLGAPADDEDLTLLRSVAQPGQWLVYQYDFGDNWQHQVEVLRALPDHLGRTPVVVAGERACPPRTSAGSGATKSSAKSWPGTPPGPGSTPTGPRTCGPGHRRGMTPPTSTSRRPTTESPSNSPSTASANSQRPSNDADPPTRMPTMVPFTSVVTEISGQPNEGRRDLRPLCQQLRPIRCHRVHSTQGVWMKTCLSLVLASLLAVSLTPAVAAPADAASSSVKWTKAKVVRWVDGDTVVTNKGTIRLIGVDTPEKGKCGSAKATRIANSTAPIGSAIRLGNPRSVDNRDRYNRSLRYVVRKSTNVDISAKQIRGGSKARYDSQDGYDWHPNQAKYRRLDRTNADFRCSGSPSTPKPTTNSWQERANQPVSAGNPDINCADIPTQYRPIHITGPDYHRLDADGDGWGCDL